MWIIILRTDLVKIQKSCKQIMDKPWLADHIKNGHGHCVPPILRNIPVRGDTPSFMPLIRNGLEQHTDYTLGGWGRTPGV